MNADDALPDESPDESLPLSLQRQIDRLCTRFEACWVAGERPRIEDFLAEIAEGNRPDALRELVLLDVHYRRRLGESCLAEDYRDRFPDMTFDLPTADASRQTEPGPTEPSTDGATRYRILRQHARGGLGVVYAAHDSELNRRVALKEIRDERAHDGASRQRFELEAVITGGLEHPGIVPIYGFGRHADGRPFYVMRFIEGASLKEAVDVFHAADRSRRDPAERASSLRHLLRRFLDVCHAIDYAHSKGVLHRDLKPGNVMLGPFGETLVVDWGLAKVTESSEAGTSDKLREAVSTSASGAAGTPTLTANAVGTPAYMSPEQAAGRHDLVGAASDIYSLGGMLYYVLTGKNPVERSETPGSSEAMPGLRRAIPRPRQVNARVPASLEAICLKAMNIDPAERYPSAGALAKDVENWIDDLPVSACRESIVTKVRRWLSCHRSFAGAGAAAMLAAVVFLGILAADTNSPNKALQKLIKDEREAKRDADRQRKNADEAGEESRKQKVIADEQTKAANDNWTRAEWRIYADNISLSQLAWERQSPELAYRYLEQCRPEFRGWEHNYLYTLFNQNQRTLRGHSRVTSVTYSPDGKRIASGGIHDKTVKVWDAETGGAAFAEGAQRRRHERFLQRGRQASRQRQLGRDRENLGCVDRRGDPHSLCSQRQGLQRGFQRGRQTHRQRRRRQERPSVERRHGRDGV